MNTEHQILLSLDQLEIGFISGNKKSLLYPAIDARATDGELIAVIGRNGIGKSTLLRTMAGLQPPLRGDILIRGRSINSYSRLQLSRQVGYISTEVVRAGDMRVYDLVALGRFPYTNWFGTIDTFNHTAIVESIEKTGLTNLSDRYIAELSDGERQRAMIAMILARDTRIIVMDEPTAFLDIRSRFEVLELMHDLARSRKKTVVFSTHDLHSATDKADKIWLMLEQGVIEGAPEDLMLKGSFDNLFESSSGKFNPLNGNTTKNTTLADKIFVAGEGAEKQLTEKAVLRAGYEVTEIMENSVVKIIPGKDCRWELKKGNDTYEFQSLYQLTAWLSDSDNQVT